MQSKNEPAGNPLLNSALEYAGRGLLVLPLHTPGKDGKCSCGLADCEKSGKHPRYHAKDLAHGLNNASRDPSQIRKWWRRWPDANIGIRTGEISGIVVLDIDPPNGEESLEDLIRTHGKIADTWESFTGRGRHLWYKHPRGLKIPSRNGFIAPNIDVKADGGYVISPPSVHYSGKQYEWELSGHPDNTALSEAPQWLIDLVVEKEKPSATTRSERTGRKKATVKGQETARWKHPVVKYKIPIGESIPKGKRETTIFAYATTLRDRNFLKTTALAILLAINDRNCKPPLTTKQVEARIESAFEKKKYRRYCRKPRLYMDEAPMKVHGYLWRAAEGTNWISLSKEEIAAATGVSERHIPRCVKALEQDGMLQILSGLGRGRKNQYRPLPPLEEQNLEKDDIRGTHLNKSLCLSPDSQDLSSLHSVEAPSRRLTIVK